MRTTKRFLKLGSLSLAVLIALAASVAVHPTRADDLTKGGKNLWRAVVQLGPIALVKNKAGKTEVRYFGWGSGTILTPDGYILTNQHVTDVSDVIEEAKSQKNIKVQEDKLVVLLTKSPDQPPVAAYIATVVGRSEKLDLALVKITHDLTGKEVDPESLDLPYIEVGNSDEVQFEDTLRIYGYPGIGGNTITFTKGNVSGFDNEQGVKGRAWIKTDATIAGGNSGGTAVNDAGQLIGIPTQAAVSERAEHHRLPAGPGHQRRRRDRRGRQLHPHRRVHQRSAAGQSRFTRHQGGSGRRQKTPATRRIPATKKIPATKRKWPRAFRSWAPSSTPTRASPSPAPSSSCSTRA